MLNRISFTDIISYIARKLRIVVFCALILALVFGCLKFILINRVGIPSAEEIESARRTAVKSGEFYNEGLERLSVVPVSQIDPYCTYTASSVIEIKSSGDVDNTDLINAVLGKWEASDLQEVVGDLYPDQVDDTALRQVIGLRSISDSVFILSVKAESLDRSNASTERVLRFLKDLVQGEMDRLGVPAELIISQPTIKCVYDFGVYTDRLTEEERLETLRTEWENDCLVLNNLKNKAEIRVPCVKWTLMGAFVGAAVSLCALIAYVIMYEPLLTSGQVIRMTDLEFLGSAEKGKRTIKTVQNSAGRGNSDDLKYAAARIADKVGKGKQLLLVELGQRRNSNVLHDFTANSDDLFESVEQVSGKVGDPQLLTGLKSAAGVILAIKYGNTRSADVQHILDLVKEYNCRVIGFISI